MLNSEPHFPAYFPPKEVSAVVLTHGHLDHSGSVPFFFVSAKTKLLGTSLTFDTARILLEDFVKLSGYFLPFEFLEIEEMMGEADEIPYREAKSISDVSISLIDAGHIPGSSQVILEGDKRILYTGDFTTIESQLQKGAELELKDLDAVVVESTYAHDEHPDRSFLEQRFVAEATEIVEDGGTVLVPAFSVGRAQEIMCVLVANNFKHPIAVDGMARKVLQIYLENQNFIKDYGLLTRASKRVELVTGKRDRNRVASRPGVIVTPAGMLRGGPSAFYMERLVDKKKAGVFLVSFQLPGTPGAILLEEGTYLTAGKLRKVKGRLRHFLFSAHAGRKELYDFLGKLNSDTKVFTVHGEEKNCEALARYAKENLNIEAVAPEKMKSYRI